MYYCGIGGWECPNCELSTKYDAEGIEYEVLECTLSDGFGVEKCPLEGEVENDM